MYKDPIICGSNELEVYLRQGYTIVCSFYDFADGTVEDREIQSVRTYNSGDSYNYPYNAGHQDTITKTVQKKIVRQFARFVLSRNEASKVLYGDIHENNI
jgi:hypothetical protein